MTQIELIIAAVLVAIGAGGLRWLLGRFSRAGSTEQATQPVPPAPPEHTAQEHETAIVLEQADIIDAVAADHDAEPNTVGELMELADATRKE